MRSMKQWSMYANAKEIASCLHHLPCTCTKVQKMQTDSDMDLAAALATAGWSCNDDLDRVPYCADARYIIGDSIRKQAIEHFRCDFEYGELPSLTSVCACLYMWARIGATLIGSCR